MAPRQITEAARLILLRHNTAERRRLVVYSLSAANKELPSHPFIRRQAGQQATGPLKKPAVLSAVPPRRTLRPFYAPLHRSGHGLLDRSGLASLRGLPATPVPRRGEELQLNSVQPISAKTLVARMIRGG